MRQRWNFRQIGAGCIPIKFLSGQSLMRSLPPDLDNLLPPAIQLEASIVIAILKPCSFLGVFLFEVFQNILLVWQSCYLHRSGRTQIYGVEDQGFSFVICSYPVIWLILKTCEYNKDQWDQKILTSHSTEWIDWVMEEHKVTSRGGWSAKCSPMFICPFDDKAPHFCEGF